MRLPKYFCILDVDNKYLISLNSDGVFTSGDVEQAHMMDVVELEEWLKIIKDKKIPYKVTTVREDFQ